MIIVDDRTPEQKKTHTAGIVGTDRFLSGWGFAEGGKSYVCWACKPEHAYKVERWVRRRSDMKRVREVSLNSYRPTGKGHLHIYVVNENHPALA